MKEYEIIYDPLIDILSDIITSPDTAAYSASITDGSKQAQFTDLIEQIDGFVEELQTYRDSKSVYNSFNIVYMTIDALKASFPDLPVINYEKLLLQITFRQKVADTLIPLSLTFTENEIDVDLFELRIVNEYLQPIYFQYFNQSNPLDSAVFFSFHDPHTLRTSIDSEQINPDFIYMILPSLDRSALSIGEQYTIIRNLTPPADSLTIPEYIKLLIVASGKRFQNVHIHTAPVNVIEFDLIRISSDYRQHREIINTLNEYNCRDELLTKYLTLYQVIEHFMFKMAVVKLETKYSGRVFSLRDFRRLYDEVSITESKAIAKFFKATFADTIAAGGTLKDLAQADWTNVVTIIPSSEIDQILDLMGMNVTYAEITAQPANFETNLSRLVYSMRNSIVHNKATEFHLTNVSITSPIKNLIESFLLPLLEKLIFHLINTRNDHVWYSNQHMILY
jgi:hypothetical protein